MGSFRVAPFSPESNQVDRDGGSVLLRALTIVAEETKRALAGTA
jgi:hypothetical protein